MTNKAIASSQTASEITTYTYNAFGERIRKVNQNGLWTFFHYGTNGELLYERDQAGNTKEYVWLDGRPIARVDNSTEIYYYHVDHLGTPQSMTDDTGSLVWKASYEPFGKATVSPASTVENNLRLPGQYFDRETSLHYNYFRDYDPTTGRYIEADPIGLEGGLNIYGYANQNPLRFTDPLGLCPRGWKQAAGQQAGVCEPDNRVEPNRCVTAECPADLPPIPQDNRTQTQIEISQCKLVCGAIWPGPILPISKADILPFVGGQVSSYFGCKWICEDPDRRNSFCGR